MAKYAAVEKDIFSLFATQDWKSNKITTIPNNYQSQANSEEFIKVTILPSGSGINLKSVSGVVIIDIFIPAGLGPNKAHLIADKLDQFLVGKSLSTQASSVTQFSGSSLTHLGADADNLTLHRSSYTIPFSYFGVL